MPYDFHVATLHLSAAWMHSALHIDISFPTLKGKVSPHHHYRPLPTKCFSCIFLLALFQSDMVYRVLDWLLPWQLRWSFPSSLVTASDRQRAKSWLAPRHSLEQFWLLPPFLRPLSAHPPQPHKF